MKRVITVDNKCHKRCCNWKHCHGFRNREHRCPQWTLHDDIENENGEPMNNTYCKHKYSIGGQYEI